MNKLALAALAFCLSVPCLSQVLPFEVYGLREGIPQSQVSALCQDQAGYLWVGTWGGLARFNGFEFKNFSQPGELPSPRIQEILAGHDGTLWIATFAGVSVWKDHRLVMLTDAAVSHVRCRALAEDAQGRVWIGTDHGLVLWQQGAFLSLYPDSDAGGPVVYDILTDRDGAWVAAINGLWHVFPDGRAQIEATPPEINPEDFRALAMVDGELWLGTYAEGVWRRRGDKSGWQPVRSGSFPFRSVYRLSVGSSGILYISTADGGLFLKRPGRTELEHWGTTNGLPSNVVSDVIEDREGNVWIATEIGGLAQLSGMSVVNHTEQQGLPSACVFGITPGDTPDSLWLGTLLGAVHYQVRPVPRVLETIRTVDGLENEWVWKVLRTVDGTLWVLSDTALWQRLPDQKVIRRLPDEVPIPRPVPWEIYIDDQQQLWVCGESTSGGVAMRDNRKCWHSWSKAINGDPLLVVAHIAKRRRGGVWISSKNRIYSSDGKTVTPLATPCPLPSSISISTICEDRRGRLWAGHDSGLLMMEPDGRWRLLNDQPGFANHHVFFIGEDQQGTVWVNTAHGVYRFQLDLSVEAFTPEDGLADWETNQHGFFNDERGVVWIGTVNGLSQYNPTIRRLNTALPRLIVENVQLANGRRMEFPDSLTLKWNERTLDIDIAVLSFRNRNRTAYRARMEGMENDWLPLRRSNELRYTNLPAGDLRLLLQPVNESGVWGETVVLPIHVRPPFWMKLWFRLAGGILLLAVALGAHRWRTLMLRRRNLELEREVGKRTEELMYLAAYDPLTGLFNRRAILKRLEREIEPEHGSNRKLGCIMVDLNRFKMVNDTLGHAAGDRVLKEMAGKIQGCLKESGIQGRLGGDEFLVLLPGADLSTLQTICRCISELTCEAGRSGETFIVTAGCGGVAIPENQRIRLAAVLAHADSLLYSVKHSGRKGFAVAAFNPKITAAAAEGE